MREKSVDFYKGFDSHPERGNFSFHRDGGILMRKILQVDGGGIRGIVPTVILAYLEDKCDKPLFCQCFNLITGTSTGAIIGGAVAAGVSANKIKEL